jgi:hypothetical protein
VAGTPKAFGTSCPDLPGGVCVDGICASERIRRGAGRGPRVGMPPGAPALGARFGCAASPRFTPPAHATRRPPSIRSTACRPPPRAGPPLTRARIEFDSGAEKLELVLAGTYADFSGSFDFRVRNVKVLASAFAPSLVGATGPLLGSNVNEGFQPETGFRWDGAAVVMIYRSSGVFTNG